VKERERLIINELMIFSRVLTYLNKSARTRINESRKTTTTSTK